MKSLTPHEERVLSLVKRNPKIIQDRKERERVAKANGMTEKTLRNRLADLKRYGLIGTHQLEPDGSITDEGLVTNLEALWRRRKFIFFNTFVFAVVSVMVSLLLPKWYKSQAVIISAGAGQTPSFLSMISGIPLADFGLSALSEDITNYIAILESRTVNEHIVERFNLIERYNKKDIEYALKAWTKNVELKATDEGALVISVLDKEPIIARDMVNAFLEELEMMNRHLATQKGKFNRQFLEARLEQNKRDLRRTEESLKAFQQRTGVVDMATQVAALVGAYGQFYSQKIEAYTGLYAQQVQTDIQLSVARATFSEDNPTLHQLQLTLQEQIKQLDMLSGELDSQFKVMLQGVSGESGEIETSMDAGKVLPSYEDLPTLALENLRLLREVEVQNKILELLLPQYEQARMEESKNVPTLQIIDEPKVAINKTKPKRALIVIATTLMALMMSISYILIEFRTREIRTRLSAI